LRSVDHLGPVADVHGKPRGQLTDSYL